MKMTPRGITVLNDRMLEIHMEEDRAANPNRKTEVNQQQPD